MAGCSACSTGIAGLAPPARARSTAGQRDRGGGERGRRQPPVARAHTSATAAIASGSQINSAAQRQHLRPGRRERPRHAQRLAETGGGRAQRRTAWTRGDRERGGEQPRDGGGGGAAPDQVVQPPAGEQREASATTTPSRVLCDW